MLAINSFVNQIAYLYFQLLTTIMLILFLGNQLPRVMMKMVWLHSLTMTYNWFTSVK